MLRVVTIKTQSLQVIKVQTDVRVAEVRTIQINLVVNESCWPNQSVRPTAFTLMIDFVEILSSASLPLSRFVERFVNTSHVPPQNERPRLAIVVFLGDKLFMIVCNVKISNIILAPFLVTFNDKITRTYSPRSKASNK